MIKNLGVNQDATMEDMDQDLIDAVAHRDYAAFVEWAGMFFRPANMPT